MNLGIFLSSGDSFTDMARYGQDIRFKQFYIKRFAKSFKKIFIFSYANEEVSGLPKNVQVIPNKYNIHRLIYGLVAPFINYQYIRQSDVLRSYHLLGTMPTIVAKIFFNKPFVFNYGYDYKEFASIEKKYFQYVLLALIHPLANFFSAKIIATSLMVMDWTPKNKVVFIPNGVDTKVFKPLIKRKNKKIKILSVGRLETQKNYPAIIQALKGLNIEYTIIGKGNFLDSLTSLARKNKVNLKIIERVANTELPKYYNNANIFAQPSLTEGPTKVLLEAMACGLPVVAANVRGIKEIIQDRFNGVFCGTDSKSIKESLLLVMKDQKLRKKIAKNARADMVQNFDIKKLLEKEIAVYRSAI